MPENNRLIRPGTAQIGAQYSSGPLVEPQTVTMQQPGGAQVIVFGGLTKLEHVATELAAAIIQASGSVEFTLVAGSAANLLQACNDVQKQDEAKPDESA